MDTSERLLLFLIGNLGSIAIYDFGSIIVWRFRLRGPTIEENGVSNAFSSILMGLD